MNQRPYDKTKLLSESDAEALAVMPDDEWFIADHLPVNRPFYRCERLVNAQKLQTRVVLINGYTKREFRKIQEPA
ncbi:hypothetical protein [Pantoea sp. BAV 3049]|uniref:hypothetical protein n=1 Tax=Pantoea sp. BAV 3049 TaxID=2654188 RepID=UPI00131AC615|nr:hypothetical protein [Pantoea sp. BAV 3049]